MSGAAAVLAVVSCAALVMLGGCGSVAGTSAPAPPVDCEWIGSKLSPLPASPASVRWRDIAGQPDPGSLYSADFRAGFSYAGLADAQRLDFDRGVPRKQAIQRPARSSGPPAIRVHGSQPSERYP